MKLFSKKEPKKAINSEISELRAKSHYIPSLRLNSESTQGTYIFFSWALFDKAKKHGVELDWNAFSDKNRQVLELIKTIYVCAEDYHETVSIFEPQPDNMLSLEKATAWAKIYNEEFITASQYIIDNIAIRFTDSTEVKKKVSLNQNSKNKKRS